MDLGFAGKSIIATGWSMGIGTTIVMTLAKEGCDAGECQAPNADVGLTHNVSGIGQYCFVQVMRRD